MATATRTFSKELKSDYTVCLWCKTKEATFLELSAPENGPTKEVSMEMENPGCILSMTVKIYTCIQQQE